MFQAITADLGNPDQCRTAVDQTIRQFSLLDIFFGNAGIGKYGPFDSLPLETWDANFNVNLRANFILTQACLPHLRMTKGAIVFTASVSGKFGCSAFPLD